jgi:hypothetical protein
MPTPKNEETFVIMTPELMAESIMSNSGLKMTSNIMFKTASAFSHFIETEAHKQNKTCMEAVLEYCDSRDIEPDAVSKLINDSLKGKIEHEMIEAGLLDRMSKLDGF